MGGGKGGKGGGRGGKGGGRGFNRGHGGYGHGGGSWREGNAFPRDRGTRDDVRLEFRATKDGQRHIKDVWRENFDENVVLKEKGDGEYVLLGYKAHLVKVWQRLRQDHPDCFASISEMECCTEEALRPKSDAERDEQVGVVLVTDTRYWTRVRDIINCEEFKGIQGSGIVRTKTKGKAKFTPLDRYKFRCARGLAEYVVRHFRELPTPTYVLSAKVWVPRPAAAQIDVARAERLLEGLHVWRDHLRDKVMSDMALGQLGKSVCRRVVPSMLTVEAIKDKIDTAEAIQNLVRQVYKDATLYMFGSCVTGLAEHTSDLDVACDLYSQRNVKKLLNNESVVVKELEKHFKKSGTFAGLQGIPRARCPILKNEPVGPARVSKGKPFGNAFDLSFRLYGTVNSYLIRNYFKAPELRVAGVIAKLWSKQVGINNPRYGYLSSYSITLMFIYYAVQRGLVEWVDPQKFMDEILPHPPPLAPVDEDEDLHSTVGQVVTGFIRFFAFDFDWEHMVVSINRPEVISKTQLGWDYNDVEYQVSQSPSIQHYFLAIEDPYELKEPGERGLNTCRALHKPRAAFVKLAFVKAYTELMDGMFDLSNFEVVAGAKVVPPPGVDFDFEVDIPVGEGDGDDDDPLETESPSDLSREPTSFSLLAENDASRTCDTPVAPHSLPPPPPPPPAATNGNTPPHPPSPPEQPAPAPVPPPPAPPVDSRVEDSDDSDSDSDELVLQKW